MTQEEVEAASSSLTLRVVIGWQADPQMFAAVGGNLSDDRRLQRGVICNFPMLAGKRRHWRVCSLSRCRASPKTRKQKSTPTLW